MKLAKSSHDKLETFFRTYFNDERFTLPQVMIYTGKFTEILTNTIKVLGITIDKRIFVKPTLLSRNRNNFLKLPEELVAHEIVHVLQYRKFGLYGFLRRYLSDYRRNLMREGKWDAESRRRAYLAIPFEIEAREIAGKFVEWNNR